MSGFFCFIWFLFDFITILCDNYNRGGILKRIDKGKDLLKLKENKFYGEVPELINSYIEFKGKNNIVFCEENVTLENSRIAFNCNDSIVYLSKNMHNYKVNISVNNKNICFFGKDNYFNEVVTVVLSEEKNVIVGNNCLFSIDVWFRVADPHLIYSADTMKRINYSKSIYIGDRVWLGQSVLLLKGTKIGSGSIIAAGAVLSNKKVISNSTWGGNPARLIKEDIFWDGSCVHAWDKEKTKSMITYNSDKFIYNYSKNNTVNFENIESSLNAIESVEERLDYIKNNLVGKSKNRFYIGKKIKFNKRFIKRIYKKIFS